MEAIDKTDLTEQTKFQRKQDHLTESLSSCLKCRLSMPLAFLFLWKTRSTQIFIVSSNGI